MNWLTLMEVWEPPNRFVDSQIDEPYNLWIHEHRFEERDGQTIMTDFVRYQLPFGFFGQIAHGLFVKKIFKTFLPIEKNDSRYFPSFYFY